MRRLIDRARLQDLLVALGKTTRIESRVYLTGGTTAVLFDWRESTVDVDLKIDPECDEILRAIPGLKESLEVNVELASPDNFIPELPGWRERSRFISREGTVSFFHYDLYAQALSKIERSHDRDVTDVAAMFERGLVEPARLLDLFRTIEPVLYRYPALDPPSFRRKVEETLARLRD